MPMTSTKKRRDSSGLGVSSSRWPRCATSMMGSSCMALLSLRFQRGVQAWVDAARVAFVDLVAVFGAQVRRRLDVALGVVEAVPGLGIDAPHGADHLAGEQDVL